MVKVNERFNHIPKIKKELEYIKNHRLVIGIFDDGKKHPDSDITMIELAMVHEFGWKFIPERSFIRAGFDKRKSKITNQANLVIEKIIFQQAKAKPAMEVLGQLVVTQLQEYMTELSSPPNAPSTIKQKGSSNPLIDEGHLRQAITYKIVRN